MRLDKQYSWRVCGTIKAGDTAKAQGREYKILNVEPYYSKSGNKSRLMTWLGACAVCGDTFIFKSGSRFWPTATCPEHRGMARTKGGQ